MATNMTNTEENIEKKTPCCELCKQVTVADWECCECELLMCQMCKDDIHSKFKFAKSHKVVNIVETELDKKTKDSFMAWTDIKCKNHTCMQCCLFCSTCTEPICVSCVPGLHRSHDFVEFSAANDIMVKSLLDFRNKLEAHKACLFDSVEDLESDRCKENVRYFDIFKAIELHEKTIVEQIRKDAEGMKHDLYKCLQDTNKTFKRELGNIHDRIQEISKSTKQTNTMINSESMASIFSEIIELKNSANDLLLEPKKTVAELKHFQHFMLQKEGIGVLVLNELYRIDSDLQSSSEFEQNIVCSRYSQTDIEYDFNLFGKHSTQTVPEPDNDLPEISQSDTKSKADSICTKTTSETNSFDACHIQSSTRNDQSQTESSNESNQCSIIINSNSTVSEVFTQCEMLPEDLQKNIDFTEVAIQCDIQSQPPKESLKPYVSVQCDLHTDALPTKSNAVDACIQCDNENTVDASSQCEQETGYSKKGGNTLDASVQCVIIPEDSKVEVKQCLSPDISSVKKCELIRIDSYETDYAIQDIEFPSDGYMWLLSDGNLLKVTTQYGYPETLSTFNINANGIGQSATSHGLLLCERNSSNLCYINTKNERIKTLSINTGNLFPLNVRTLNSTNYILASLKASPANKKYALYKTKRNGYYLNVFESNGSGKPLFNNPPGAFIVTFQGDIFIVDIFEKPNDWCGKILIIIDQEDLEFRNYEGCDILNCDEMPFKPFAIERTPSNHVIISDEGSKSIHIIDNLAILKAYVRIDFPVQAMKCTLNKLFLCSFDLRNKSNETEKEKQEIWLYGGCFDSDEEDQIKDNESDDHDDGHSQDYSCYHWDYNTYSSSDEENDDQDKKPSKIKGFIYDVRVLDFDIFNSSK